MKINLNQYVKAKLTDVGRAELKRQGAELRQQWPKLPAYVLPKEDAEGYVTMQLHSLMQQLGHMVYLGCEPPFEIELIVIPWK